MEYPFSEEYTDEINDFRSDVAMFIRKEAK